MLTVVSDFQPIDVQYRLEIDIPIEVVLNEVDKFFTSYTGLNWTGTNGSTLTITSQKMHVDNTSGTRGARLSGSGVISDFVDGRLYTLLLDITSYTGVITVKSYSTSIQIAQQSISGSGQINVTFKANGHGNGIVVEGTGNFVMDNLNIEMSGNLSLLSFDSIEIGADDDDNLIQYPGRCSLSVMEKNDITASDLYFLIDEHEPYISLQKLTAGSYSTLYRWKIYRGDADYDLFKIIDISGTDDYKLLESVIEKSGSPEFYEGSTMLGMKEFLMYLLTYNGTIQSLGSTSLLDFRTGWRVYDEFDAAILLEELFVPAFMFFSTNVPFETRWDILKAIMANINATILRDIDGKYYILPLEYQGASTVLIKKSEFLDADISVTEEQEGEQYYLYSGTGGYDLTLNEGDYKIYYPFPNTAIDGQDIGGTMYSVGLKTNKDASVNVKSFFTQMKNRSGSWTPDPAEDTEQSSFYGLTQPLLADQRSGRNKIEVELSGIDYPVYQWYMVESIPGMVFRVRRKEIDLIGNKTKLILVEG